MFLLFWTQTEIYIFIYLYIYICTHTGHMTVMLENGGNFENGTPNPDYQIHLVLDQIPYDLQTKTIFRTSTWCDLEKE